MDDADAYIQAKQQPQQQSRKQQQQEQRQKEEDEKGEGEEDEGKPCRILILGDGNFSFSLALARALLLRWKKKGVDIVATSFDGRLDLLGKYPESSGIVAGLRALGVNVLHNVDATALDARVILAACAENHAGTATPAEKRGTATIPPMVTAWVGGSGGDCRGGHVSDASDDGDDGRGGGASRSRYPRRQYDHIIFNHPHTGTEDMRLHRSFLGHFFHDVVNAAATRAALSNTGVGSRGDSGGPAGISAPEATAGAPAVAAAGDQHGRSILAPEGAVHVTLAGDQPERWGLSEQAARHGFALVHRRRFPAERIDGYMTKRHQTGRSFQRRSLDSETLSFSRASTNNGGEFCAAGEGFEGGRSDPVDAERGGAVGTGRQRASMRTLPPWLWPEVDMRGEGPGLKHEEVTRRDGETVANEEGNAHATHLSAAAGLGLRACGNSGSDGRYSRSALPEVCGLCGKRYKTAQALRTHTRQLHELGQEGGVAAAEQKDEACPHCDRVLTSARALDQHVLAKHRGDNVDIKPDWYVGSIYLDPPQPRQQPGERGIEEALERSCIITEEAFLGGGGVKGGEVTTEGEEKRRADDASVLATTPPASDDRAAWHCAICAYWFATREDLKQHLDNLRPPIEGGVTRHECVGCIKEFASRRALLQHANFCGRGSAKT